jgi:hypothetical protein
VSDRCLLCRVEIRQQRLVGEVFPLARIVPGLGTELWELSEITEEIPLVSGSRNTSHLPEDTDTVRAAEDVELCCDILQDTSPHPSVAPWEQEMTLDQVLMMLPSMALARAQFEENLVQWVRKARSLGATWSRIGEALDMTRQSAWERFSGEE